jgi:ABC-type protease/lipase transport system fused ATPase/permease subunit
MLNGPLFMLQVYDRVLSSQSKETLLFLTLLAAGVLIFQSLMEIVRSNLLIRAGAQLDSELQSQTFGLSFDGKTAEHQTSSAQGLRDLDAIRGFLSGSGLIALFDAPIVFLLIVFAIHRHYVLRWSAPSSF